MLREARALQAQGAQALPDMWNGGVGSAIGAAPMMMMGNPKAASQTYNAGSLFTNSATAITKG
jgi:hypothetical protein